MTYWYYAFLPISHPIVDEENPCCHTLKCRNWHNCKSSYSPVITGAGWKHLKLSQKQSSHNPPPPQTYFQPMTQSVWQSQAWLASFPSQQWWALTCPTNGCRHPWSCGWCCPSLPFCSWCSWCAFSVPQYPPLHPPSLRLKQLGQSCLDISQLSINDKFKSDS